MSVYPVCVFHSAAHLLNDECPSHLKIDKTIQEIAVKHKVHPNQVSTWKRQAMDGLGAIFSNGVDKVRVDHESELHDLHAKIGQLTVERDFLARGFKR